MSILRIEALRMLADCIADRVPDLRGNICAGPAEAPHRLAFPSLVIDPVRFRYFPDQESEHVIYTSSVGPFPPGTALLNVGRHEATVQLRLGAGSARARAILSQAILDLFLEREGAPGVLVMQVPQCLDATIAWELDADEWEDELAFDKKWYSIMTTTLQLPALITRGNTYRIEELRVAFTEDLTTPIASVPAADIEAVAVALDGSISPTTRP